LGLEVQAASKIKIFVEGIDADMCRKSSDQSQNNIENGYVP